MNNIYKIKVESPLLRAGLSIETECSEKYLVPVLNKVFEKVREFNTQENNTTKPSRLDEGVGAYRGDI